MHNAHRRAGTPLNPVRHRPIGLIRDQKPTENHNRLIRVNVKKRQAQIRSNPLIMERVSDYPRPPRLEPNDVAGLALDPSR